uniref:CBM1 domain-containing protein n=1 Tax=Globisporangium ultimum (strain ATCC 200006 / CBS 805.95 / DAOM BR144) TaxID=431595 RepID=K3X984_GLOUD
MWFEEGSAEGSYLDDEGDSVDGVGDGYGIDWTNWSWPDDVIPDMWKDAIGPFGQCGGTGYAGNETCIENWLCVQFADAFAECLPVSSVVTANGTVVIAVPPLPTVTIAPAPVDSSSSGSLSNEPEPPAAVTTAPFPSTPAPTTTLPPASATDSPSVSSGSGDHHISQFDKVKPWQQCGGRNFNYTHYGATHGTDNDTLRLTCTAGYQCDVINDWFFQCVPVHDTDSVALWSQCGGAFHQGRTNCVASATCRVFNDWYAQCVPV